MPLPDATPDKRIYELLKTVDLENLTFADLQAVGQSIFAEQGAEDELRRLVLLNLARLSVVGEWTGLTSAGGGGALAKLYNPKAVTPSTYSDPLMQIFGNYTSTGIANSGYSTSRWRDYYWLFPFYAQGSGKITDMRYRVDTAHTGDGTALDTVFYNTDDNGQPATKIGTATMDLTSTGTDKSATITETSTDSMTLTAGELYWIGYKEDGTTGVAVVKSFAINQTNVIAVTDFGTNSLSTFNCYTSLTAPATWSASDLVAVGNKEMVLVGGVFS
jgi:hypothetical protein